MNQSNSYLVKVDNYRHVSVADNGTVYLAWDRVTVQLDAEEVHLLAQTLQEETPEEMPPVMPEAGHSPDFDGFEESVQLWLGDIALMLTMPDFEVFMQMVLEAAIVLELEEFEVEYITAPPVVDILGENGEILFSLN